MLNNPTGISISFDEVEIILKKLTKKTLFFWWKFKDYQFIPGKQHDKVDLLIASTTPELRDELIKHYVKNYAEKYSFEL